MISLKRASLNPIITPSAMNIWEKKAAFNGSVAFENEMFNMVYRAQSETTYYQGHNLSLATIGLASSRDGVQFTNHKQFITPEYVWELFGCEDPRITYFENKYYIFYTALSNYPFNASGIKVGLAISPDMKTIESKRLITPFNAKAMALFPERVNGKIVTILSANTDLPPSKISLAYFDHIEELWDEEYWKRWYKFVDDHTIPLLRKDNEQVEVGAVPIKTKHGWLLIYSYIKNYHSDQKEFSIEAALLDLNNPREITAKISYPLLIPETDYERFGEVPNIVFPTGAVIQGDILNVYYGAADTTTCLARCNIHHLLNEMTSTSGIEKLKISENKTLVKRFEENPILLPLPESQWENKAVFNPAAIYENKKIHLVYRAMSSGNQSVFGYASSDDGLHITERLPDPIYIPREIFEKNTKTGYYGCEDPRLTKLDNRFYVLYTAYDGENPPRVAMSSIAVDDFLSHHWHWAIPKLISPPGIDDKDACIFPKQISGKFIFLHRLQSSIWIDEQEDLHFYEGKYLGGRVLIEPRPGLWDSVRIGISSLPIETDKGWILLYHGIDENHNYHLGACLLDLEDPEKVISRLDYPILSPLMHYEKEGQVPNVVFPCGSVVINGTIFIYYGGADSVLCVGTLELDKLLNSLTNKLLT